MKGKKSAVFVSLCSSILLACSAWVSAQQIPNITRGEPGTYITGPAENPELGSMGRLAILGALGDYIITIPEGPGSGPESSLITEAWDLSDLQNPRRLDVDLGPTYQPFQAHGTLKTYRNGEALMDIGGGDGAFIIPGQEPTRRPIGIEPNTDESTYRQWNKSTLHYPWSGTVWGSYGPVDRFDAELYFEMERVGTWDHFGQANIVGMPNFMGNLMIFVSDQANDGVATYDVSDPSSPRLLDLLYDEVGVINPDNSVTSTNVGVVVTPENRAQVTRARTIGGYWQEISGHYVVIASRPNDVSVFRGGVIVVDFEDPENLRVHCYIELDDDPMYVGFQDEHVFTDRWKVDIEACEVEVQFEEDLHNTEMSQYALPLGNVVAIGGIEDSSTPEIEQGMSIWVHQSEPDLRAPYAAYHIPQDGRTNYPPFAPVSISIPETLRIHTMVPGVNIIAREVGGETLGFDYRLSHAGMLTINPDGDWPENATIEITLTGIEDYMHNAMETYSFRFSTGDSVNLDPTPDPDPDPNQAPSISAFTASSTDVFVGRIVTLNVSANDLDGDTLNYTFDTGVGSPVQSSSSDYSFSYSAAGEYTVQVTVSDPDDESASDTLQITVTEEAVVDPNQAPTINSVVTDPASMEIFTDEVFSVTVTGSDPDGDTLTYQLSGEGLASQSSSDGAFDVSFPASGSYEIELVVFDESGAQDSESLIGIEVLDRPLPNRAPTINEVYYEPVDRLLAVGETGVVTVSALDPDGDALTFIFDDGVNPPVSTGSSTYSFSYDVAGRYNFRVRVQDPDGESDSHLRSMNVFDPVDVIEVPNSSSQIDFDAGAGIVWTVNPDNGSAVGLDPESNNVITRIAGLADPHSILVSASGLIWLTSTDEDLVEVYSADGSLVRSISTGYGSAPFHVVESHDGAYIYVSLFGANEVLKIDAATYENVGSLAVDGKPRAMSISESDDLLLVTRFISPENWGEIWAVNTSDMSLRETIRLAKSDTPDSIINGRGVPNYLTSVVIAPGSEYAYYAAKKDNTDLGPLTGSTDLDDDNTVRAIVGKIDLSTLTEDYQGRRDLDNRESPAALAIAPTADHLFIAMQGKNEVFGLLIGDDGRLGQEDGSFVVGSAPQGLVFDLLTADLYVKNFLGRSVSRLILEGFLAGQGSVVTDTYITVAAQDEVLESEVLNGKRIFYLAEDEGDRMSAEGYISCATCHLDGTYDGRTWDFSGRGEGLRNTTSLVGRKGIRFGNLHWSGNFDEVQDFEHDIRDQFRGNGFTSLTAEQLRGAYSPLGTRPKAGLSQDLDDLAAYVSSLGQDSLPRSTFRTESGDLTAAGNAGQQIFNDLNCQQCHADMAFTDGVSHDVGTLRSYSGNRLRAELTEIRTPSLLGVFDSAPYFHDGSAATLEDVFDTVGGDVYAAEDFIDTPVEQPTLGNLRGHQAALLNVAGDILNISSVNGGSGGAGLLRVRGAGMQGGVVSLTLIVNDEEAPISFDFGESLLVGDEQSNIVELTGIDITLNPDATNVISFRLDEGSVPVLIDDITVSTAAHLAQAEPHRVAASLGASDRENLVSYLKQLDRASAPADDAEVVLGFRETPPPAVGTPPQDDIVDEPTPVDPPEPQEPISSGGEAPSLLPGGEDGAGSGDMGLFLILLMLLSSRLGYRRVFPKS